jgi:hypothetical protein
VQYGLTDKHAGFLFRKAPPDLRSEAFRAPARNVLADTVPRPARRLRFVRIFVAVSVFVLLTGFAGMAVRGTNSILDLLALTGIFCVTFLVFGLLYRFVEIRPLRQLALLEEILRNPEDFTVEEAHVGSDGIGMSCDSDGAADFCVYDWCVDRKQGGGLLHGRTLPIATSAAVRNHCGRGYVALRNGDPRSAAFVGFRKA